MPRMAPTNLYVIADCQMPTRASGCVKVSMRSTG